MHPDLVILQMQIESYKTIFRPQIFKRLSVLGCTESHEDKLLALKDFILKLHRARLGYVRLVDLVLSYHQHYISPISYW